jgi:hypothetical protein
MGETMRKTLIAGFVLALCTTFAAHAQTSLTLQPAQTAPRGLSDDVTEVHTHSSTGGVIFRDTFGGAVLGAAAGGGYALYQKQNNNNGDWGNWQRPVLIGAGVGAAIGLVFGLVDATTWSDRSYSTRPYADRDRQTVGFSPPSAQYGLRF